MQTCSRCPCPLYTNPPNLCYHCSNHASSPPNRYPKCTRCDKHICSEHASDLSVEVKICHTCMVRSGPDQIGLRPNDREEGLYIPAYLRGGSHWQNRLALVPAETHADKSCLICATDIMGGTRVTKLSCTHVFHVDCIVPWFNQSPTCPLCRRTFPEYS